MTIKNKRYSLMLEKFKTIPFNGKLYVFCLIRKKYCLLTKEEVVRQQLISYLIKNRGYNVNEIYVEFKYSIHNMTNKIDIIVFKKKRPFIIVECKSNDVNISYKYFDQILKYYLIIKSKYLVLTNGIKNIIFGFQNNANDIEFFKKIPKNS
ncbi:type I restriction enzyme HsdR N-terminal domain-containing protein [Candidatus Karelsulcia muelleri]|uniref:type I restriction enzyme HsdR N-terminal domain-containing protein n=1 Tax=Candidatus Karelsulcia muelleri TaxID=336810 RepID=UPI002364675F|nr:type I restriction enzyme HsdR N-terminal domain-containing protein [Candidatus Karelsulcia muelleri]WDE42271.1 type I restriction enzyme HsdR N-terminal domain-containing protein [Candidatus Karelsulcia muelleri]WDR79120.1 type I restriction enzyme HsdR N-terminal domain-containing protein [Candidatus Karelsulcia muelleri]